MRSILLVGGDSSADYDGALASGADALMFDVAERPLTTTWLDTICGWLNHAVGLDDRPLLFVRIPPADGAQAFPALSALVRTECDGIVLGRSRGGQDVQQLGVRLAVIEAELDWPEGQVPIIAEAGSTGSSIFSLGSFQTAGPRLMGLLWDANALASDLDILPPADGSPPAPLATARSLVLLAARASDVSAIEGPSDVAGDALFSACEQARRDGFNAKIARNADEVAVINAVFDRGG